MSEASINQILKQIGYHGKATGHGFRHAMSTILHEQGYNTAWIELQLAHVDKNTIRGTYNHAQYLCKHTSFSSTHFLKFPGFQPSACTLPASGYSGIHEVARCCIQSTSAL